MDSTTQRSDLYRRRKNMSARDLQAQALEQLFEDPERNEKVAERPKIPHAREPWDRIRATLGSNAGPGSGEFHVYRELRRLESDRVNEMVDDGKQVRAYLQAEEQAAYEKRMRLHELEDSEKTAKNRARRERRKQVQRDAKKRRVEHAEPEKRGAPENASGESASAAPQAPQTHAAT